MNSSIGEKNVVEKTCELDRDDSIRMKDQVEKHSNVDNIVRNKERTVVMFLVIKLELMCLKQILWLEMKW